VISIFVFALGRHLDWEKRGGNTEGATKKDFGAIPYSLVIADYKKAFQYEALKKFLSIHRPNR
jgi:hypothetical protein